MINEHPRSTAHRELIRPRLARGVVPDGVGAAVHGVEAVTHCLCSNITGQAEQSER
jgi:hypothetical protein